MKRYAHFCFIVILSVTLFSCSNEKILIKYTGGWNLDKTITTTTIDGVSTVQTVYDSGIVTFKDDGTGTITYSGGGAETFTWEAIGDTITITYDLTAITIEFLVLGDSANDYQHWSGTYTYDLLGTAVEVDTDLTMGAIGS